MEEKPQPHFVSQFDRVYSVEDKKFFIGELITPMRYIRKISILVCNRNHTCLHYVCRVCNHMVLGIVHLDSIVVVESMAMV